MNFKSVKEKLKELNVSIKRTTIPGEFKINRIGNPEATSYYTDDLEDAFYTGLKY